ncbi:MAG TPA: CHAD domain-containing protein [Solirubrobacteraceae bacterium]|nr:CHAD domain-containing protein [Solirubrobacteraceae bacterium]
MSGRGELLAASRPLDAARVALGPIFTVEQETSCDELVVRDELEKIVCRLSAEQTPGLGWWVALHPLRGYEREHGQIEWLLQQGAFVSADAWSNVKVPMQPGERADAAVSRVLLRLRDVQEQNLPGTLAGTDMEYLHDFRVSIRRTRSVLREMRGVFTPDDLERVRASFKWLQDQTSATRDLDVYLHEFDELRTLTPETMRADLDPLRDLLSERRRRARNAMEAALQSDAARALHDGWGEILQVLVLDDEQERPDAARPIGAVAAKRIRKVHRKMVKMGREITPESPPEQYHELRKKGKELRYLLELFAMQLFDADVVKPMIKALKGVQDVLGLHQDREVQIEMLKEIGGDLVGEPGGAGALMAIGVLVERLEADAKDARSRFAASFAEFASDRQCKLVTEAFS